MSLVFIVFVAGIILIGIGIYQKKTYYNQPHFQDVHITGYQRFKSGMHGLDGMAVNAITNAVGIRYPVVDVTLSDGSLKTVPLNVTVTDDVIAKFPEFDVGGTVSVKFFGEDPKTVYLLNHPMAQTVLDTSLLLLLGIGTLVMAVVLLFVFIFTPRY